MKKLRGIWLNLLVALLFVAPMALASVPTISGFITQADGNLVNASTWNSQIGAIYTYINANLVSTLNLLNAKGNILSCDGSNIVALANAGAGDNGKALVLDSTATPGIKWSAISSVTTLTTKGDLLGYSSTNARVPVGADGTILTADSTNANGVSWQSGSTSSVPSGIIAMWGGAIGSIPSGWHLCDGTSGTPNLQGMFILGAGNASPAATGGFGLVAVAATAGTTTHTHSVSVTGSGTTDNNTTAAAGGSISGTCAKATHAHTFTVTSTGTSGTTSTAPAYYALAYIQKL